MATQDRPEDFEAKRQIAAEIEAANKLVAELPLPSQFEYQKQVRLITQAKREQVIALYQRLLAHHLYYKYTVEKTIKRNG